MPSITRRDALRLGAVGFGCSIAGCPSGGSGEPSATSTPTSSATETPTDTATATETASSVSTTSGGCEWPEMCEGTRIVKLSVSSGFSGDVLLHADCREDEFSIEPGGSVTIGRRVDGEECDIRIMIDGEEAHSADVEGHERMTFTVTRDGELLMEVTSL